MSNNKLLYGKPVTESIYSDLLVKISYLKEQKNITLRDFIIGILKKDGSQNFIITHILII